MNGWAGREPYPNVLSCVGRVLGTPVYSTHLAGVKTVYFLNWYKAQTAPGPCGEKKIGNIEIQTVQRVLS